MAAISHRQVRVERADVHIAECEARTNRTILFLHGWPQDWSAFENVMRELQGEARLIAIDLPGIGESKEPPISGDKRSLARFVSVLIRSLDLHAVTLVGHDIGAQVVYSFLRSSPRLVERAAIMDVVIPGVPPWNEVERNPNIWHFAFHAVRNLPEKLVSGHQAEYFDYFFDTISANPEAVRPEARRRYSKAYERSQSLHTGFEWYRAFPIDARDNACGAEQPVDIPVLYVRGDQEGDIEPYLRGLRDSGIKKLSYELVSNCGHFSPDEQPKAVAEALRRFLGI